MENVKVVNITTSKKYKVIIGKGILDNLCSYIESEVGKSRAIVVTDSNVDKIYSNRVLKNLIDGGMQCEKIVIEAGEQSKNSQNFVKILEFFAKNKLTRSDIAIALGGGVVGDITGFAAACYLRGIKFVQVPTTLLSSVDSSVGGKTGIDLEQGKNLAGAFHQPSLVVCDTDTFKTLPEVEVSNGFAEIIKYAALFDKEFFDILYKKNFDIDDVVEKCVKFKNDVVTRDEFESGDRKLLNLGHTAAHAIEKYSDYKVPHGSAVAIGMVIAGFIANNMGIFEKVELLKLVEILKKYNLPVKYDMGFEEMYKLSLSDKKCEGQNITLVLPEKIGVCRLEKIPSEKLCDLYKDALFEIQKSGI